MTTQATRGTWQADVAAGLTTAVLLIPQAMAYAMLAGLPPIVGLYASTFPILAYALLGTGRSLAVGPVAMDSLLVASGVGAIAAAGSDQYIAYAVALAFMAGLLQVVLGLARAGFLVNFLSQPVVSGFTSAAALIIGFSQLQHLLALKLPRTNHIHKIAYEALSRVSEIHLITLLIGVGAITTLVVLKRYAPKVPRALVVVAATTLLVWGFGLHGQGVSVVGEVPAGLPGFALPQLDIGTLQTLGGTAAVIALVAFMEAYSVARAIADREGYEVDANRELIALGASNLTAGLFHGYPVTGGFSRTAVNSQAGAKSKLAGVVTAVVVIVTLLFLTDLFQLLPKTTLAAIIMTAVFGLIDLKTVRRLWTTDRADLGLLGLTFATTLALGIQLGIATGVAASLLLFIVRTTRPHTAVLGRIPETEVYRNVERFPEAIQTPGVLVLRIDASLYFSNVAFLKDIIRQQQREREDLTKIVIDASSVNRLDSSAELAFRDLIDELERSGIALHFAGVKGPVYDVMQRSGLYDKLGTDRFHLRIHDAISSRGGMESFFPPAAAE